MNCRRRDLRPAVDHLVVRLILEDLRDDVGVLLFARLLLEDLRDDVVVLLFVRLLIEDLHFFYAWMDRVIGRSFDPKRLHALQS